MRRAALAVLFLASAAEAQVTADDVWAAQERLYAAMGLSLSGTLNRDGTVVTVTGIGGAYDLPLGAGTLSWRASDIVLTENADGSVSTDPGASSTVAMVLDLQAPVPVYVTAEAAVTATGWQGTVSGTAEDVLWTTAYDALAVETRNVTVIADGIDETPGIVFFLQLEDVAATSRMILSDRIEIISEGRIGRTVTDVGLDLDGMVSRSVSEGHDTVYDGRTVLPGLPLDLMNLGPALRAGLSFEGSATSGLSQSQSVTLLDGEVVSDQGQTIGSLTQAFRLDAAGLWTEAVGADLGNLIAQPMLGLRIDFDIARVEAGFAMPLLAGRAPLSFEFGIDGLSVGDGVWALVGLVPDDIKGAADLHMALQADIELERDLTDIMGLIEAAEALDVPLRLFDITLEDLSAAWNGASVTATGALGWGPAGAVPDDMMPPPEGRAFVTIAGAYQLIDRLSAAGVLPQEAELGLRGALAGFGKPSGEDRVESEIVFGPGGSLTVNGAPVPF